MLGSNNPFPSVLFAEETSSVVNSGGSQAISSNQQRVFADSADGDFQRKTASGAVYRLARVLSNPTLADPSYVTSGDVWFTASGASPFRTLYINVREGSTTLTFPIASY